MPKNSIDTVNLVSERKVKPPYHYVSRFPQLTITKTQTASKLENLLLNELILVYKEHRITGASIKITSKALCDMLGWHLPQLNRALLELDKAKIIINRTREKITLNSNYYWVGNFEAWKDNTTGITNE